LFDPSVSSALTGFESATLEWVWWFNYHRLLGPIGHVPPVEYEEAYYMCQEGSIEAVGPKENSLR
jgi:transposase InsO family protein